MVLEALQEDIGDGSMQCTNHPFKTTTPGGICAFCLQEKLGKLVSSSVPTAIFPSSSSSPSPSFRSDYGVPKSILSLRPNTSASSLVHTSNNPCPYKHYHSTRAFHRIPFFPTQKRKKKKDFESGTSSNTFPGNQASIVFKRSKSTATPHHGGHFTDADEDNSPRKRGFWSFLYLTKHSSNRKIDTAGVSSNGSFSQRETKREEFAAVDESESPAAAGVGRKVSRSRSVGCGSRSFSGDFFERISTGFGDCTLRRVESQREGKHRITPLHHRRGGGCGGHEYIKERVKCGGIFSGFMITSSSSSSSSSSYLVSSSGEDGNMNGRPAAAAAAATPAEGRLAHGRSKSWGWAFASPIRAFSKPSSNGKREGSNKNTTNFNAIPSLLAVRG